jgi:hypothetical protein
MSSIHVGKSAGPQIKLGAAILAAAHTADMRLIKNRLAAFEHVQQRYVDAHAKVQQVEADLEKAQAQFRTDQQAVVDALARLETLGVAVRDARSSRDAVAPAWEAALGALRRGARAAAADGATTLYATLFDRPARSNGKNHKPAPAPAPTPSPTVSPTPQPEPAAS